MENIPYLYIGRLAHSIAGSMSRQRGGGNSSRLESSQDVGTSFSRACDNYLPRIPDRLSVIRVVHR